MRIFPVMPSGSDANPASYLNFLHADGSLLNAEHRAFNTLSGTRSPLYVLLLITIAGQYPLP